MPAAADAGSDEAVPTIDGAASRVSLDSATAQTPLEATHVDGALAEHAANFAWSCAPETVAFAASLPFTMTFPDLPETLPGGIIGAEISVPAPGDSAVALDSVGTELTTAPSPRSFLDPDWLAARAADSAAPVALEASQVAPTDPASLEGAAVLAIGPALLVLSNWPESA